MKKDNIQEGDYIEINFSKHSYQGVLIESPIEERDTLLIRLDNGYIIGFNKKDILSINLLKKGNIKNNFYSQKEEKNLENKNSIDNTKLNVALVVTGGTIASKIDTKTGAVSPIKNINGFLETYPEIFESVNIVKLESPFMKLSEDMGFKDWKKIAKVCVSLLKDKSIQGIVVTHGTDTLHYTASALSFFIKNINKPIILTYSQKSIDRGSSDAYLNLKCALNVIKHDLAGVFLVGHGDINDNFCYGFVGTKVRKLHSSKRDAFKSVNIQPLLKIYPNGKIEQNFPYKKRNNAIPELDDSFEEKIAILKIYPNQDPDILNYYLKKGYRGVILEMTGLGHCPGKNSDNSWIKTLKEVQKKGLIICGVSQCIFGRVDPFVYSTGREILKTGVIYLEDMLAETAFVKLGWVLGHKDWINDKKIIKEKMLENLSGELNSQILG
jgi:glutamyl-tRNA(Gln) amidotransferase subunit D